MESLMRAAVQENESLKKQTVPWKPDEPYTQHYFQFDSSKPGWESKVATVDGNFGVDGSGLTTLALFSWNIDFMLPFAKPRMEAALAHLEMLTASLDRTSAVIVFLQECVQSDLLTIREKAWIQSRFHVTDVDTSNWASGYYGTTMLIDRRLPISSCFRVHYERTRMGRDALFVDVLMGCGKNKTIRLCNSHLESLALEPPLRPQQLQLVARYMHAEGIHGALVAGDFNAIQSFDRALHHDNDLRDAYLELGGSEDSDAGYTWGQQAATALREKFGCSRMDKILFSGNLVPRSFGRFGEHVELSEARQRDEIVALGFERPWITDHLGISAEFKIVE